MIEEDGKTEEEFITDLIEINEVLETLSSESALLSQVIAKNIEAITGGD